MQSVRVETLAFDRPGGEEGHPSRARPIDLVHLARQTFGDRALEAEILQLFASQAASARHSLRAAGAEDRKRLAHGIKGSARGVGAFPLADAAAVLELQPSSTAQVRIVEERIDEISDFIASISR